MQIRCNRLHRKQEFRIKMKDLKYVDRLLLESLTEAHSGMHELKKGLLEEMRKLRDTEDDNTRVSKANAEILREHVERLSEMSRVLSCMQVEVRAMFPRLHLFGELPQVESPADDAVLV